MGPTPEEWYASATMRRGILALGSVGVGLAATAFAACGGNAVGVCDFGECTQISLLDGGEDATSSLDAPNANEGSANEEGGAEDGNADAPLFLDASCGADASTQYCGPTVGCVDTTSSPTNCNACGNACPAPANATATCIAGTCGIACDSTFVQCPQTTQCVDPNDPAHCGATCTVCPSPAGGNGAASCPSGSCTLTCNSGYFLCDSTCHSDNAPPTDACVVTEQFGVFVAPGGTGTGTRAAPFGSIQAGLAAAQTQGLGRVYVCGGTLAGAVAFTASSAAVTVYGGFQCGSWTYAPTTQHVVVAPPSGVPLTFNGSAAAIAIENIEFDAANATGFDAHGNGNSSIAAFAVNATNVSLVGVTLKAGNGVSAGAAAAPASNYGGGATAPSGEGPALLDAGTTTPGSITCADGTSSKGGGGGESSAATGGVASGGPGVWTPPGTTSPSTGFDGAGGAAGTGATSSDQCRSGDPGANGAAATTAASGAGTWGTLTASGWSPTAGTNGTNGNPGQGGGGGGGATIPVVSGGSGGAGGCGGTGGLAGVGGGSSFALLALNSAISLTASCSLSAGNAGAGGGGSSGENGQNGGGPGLSTCSGGYGGNGAGGGGGGGGAAGVSAGIGYVGTTAPTPDTTTTYALGAVSGASGGGAGGNAGTNADGTGNNGPAGGTGIAGKSQDVLPL